MPAVSKAQQRLMAMALHDPSKVSKKNRGVLKMNKKQLREFVKSKSKKLPKHKNAIRSLVEGNAAVARKVAMR